MDTFRLELWRISSAAGNLERQALMIWDDTRNGEADIGDLELLKHEAHELVARIDNVVSMRTSVLADPAQPEGE